MKRKFNPKIEELKERESKANCGMGGIPYGLGMCIR